jgi:uncharacterized protein (DUF1684 family)
MPARRRRGARVNPLDNPLDAFRRHKDEFFQHSPESPLDEAAREQFGGLRYYPENPALRLTLRVDEFPEKELVSLQTSTGDVRSMQRWGKFHFEVDGRPAELTVYYSPGGGYFVPFRDATSGAETYGAGRYLEIEPLGDGTFGVDFNLAYNPWCAYSPHYSCPIPPAENRLAVPIRAGELDYHAPPADGPSADEA